MLSSARDFRLVCCPGRGWGTMRLTECKAQLPCVMQQGSSLFPSIGVCVCTRTQRRRWWRHGWVVVTPKSYYLLDVLCVCVHTVKAHARSLTRSFDARDSFPSRRSWFLLQSKQKNTHNPNGIEGKYPNSFFVWFSSTHLIQSKKK